MSSPGLRATPSLLVKVFRSDTSVLPHASPDAAGLCLTPAGFGSGQPSAQPHRRIPKLERRVLYLQGFECSLKAIFKNDLLPLNQSLYPYAIVALSCPSCPGAGTICRSLSAIG